MNKQCARCGKSFSRRSILKKHLLKCIFTLSGIFEVYKIPKSVITDAICDAGLVHLPTADAKRLESFGQRIPSISSVNNWKQSYSFDDIRKTMLSDILQSNRPLRIWDADESTTDDYITAATVILRLDAEQNPPQGYITDIPIPSLENQVVRTRELHDNYTIYITTPVSGNATPKLNFIDVHHDSGYVVVTLYGGLKIWLIWPPTEENLQIVRNLYGKGNRFLRCYKKLKGGVFIVQKAGQTLLLPPYNLHATFAIGGSIMCGYEFEALELFPQKLSCLHAEINLIDNDYEKEDDRRREHASHFRNVLEGLERTLTEGNDATKEEVVKAWITNIDNIKAILQKIGQKTGDYEEKACDIWKNYLEDTIISKCPSCPANSRQFQDHMTTQHVEIIRSRPRKRIR